MNISMTEGDNNKIIHVIRFYGYDLYLTITLFRHKQPPNYSIVFAASNDTYFKFLGRFERYISQASLKIFNWLKYSRVEWNATRYRRQLRAPVRSCYKNTFPDIGLPHKINKGSCNKPAHAMGHIINRVSIVNNLLNL